MNDDKKELELWPGAIVHLGEHSRKDEEEGEGKKRERVRRGREEQMREREEKMRENSGERNR